MLNLGTTVQYGDQKGKVVGRTIEREPKYDILFADGKIRQYIPEGSIKIADLPVA